MMRNLGPVDRAARIGLAIVLAAFPLTGVLHGAVALLAYLVAGVLLVTAIVGICPLYTPFHVNTRPHAPGTGGL
jgi:Inner membrane protein YgaP-like, transmembrane domain